MLQLELAVPSVFILAAVFYALLGLYAWRRRPAVAVVSFTWAMLAMSVWSFMYGVEIFLPSLPAKLAAVDVEYIGIVSAPVFLFFFALEYTGRSHVLTARTRVLIWLLPLFFLLLAWTNPIHNWMWDMERIETTGGLRLLGLRFGWAFWFHIVLSYGLYTIAGAMLVMDFLQRPGASRFPITFVIAAMAFSFLGTILFTVGPNPVPNLDFTPLFFLPTSIGLAWATLRYRLAEMLAPEYVAVLKNMPDSVIVLNGNRRILYVNPGAEQLLGKTEDEAIGQPFDQAAGAFAAALKACLDENKARAEIQLPAVEGAKTYAASISTTFTQSDLGETVISLHDITGHKEREAELNRRDAIMSAISAMAELFLKSSSWKGNILGILKSLGQAADVCRVFIVLNSTDADGVVYSSLEYEWAAPGIEPQINNPNLKNVPLINAGFGRWLETLSRGRPVYGLVKDLPESESTFMAPLGSLSIAAIPIFVEGQWWAFMMFDECRRERQWTEMELDAFQTAASIFGAAEARDRASQKLMSRQLGMSMLNYIVAAALQAETLGEMAEIATRQLANLIGAQGCFMTLWDEETKLTIPLAAYGIDDIAYSQIRPEPGQRTFTRSALELGRTLVVEDAENTAYADHNIVKRFPSKSILALPLIVQERKLGAVLIAFNDFHRFTDEEIEISEQAAALIALALEKFQAMDEAKRRADTAETLRKAGIAIAEQSDFKQAINRILDQLNQVVPYDSASVQLLKDGELEIVDGRGWTNEDDVLGMRFPIPSDNPNTAVIETGKPYRLGDAGKVYQKFNEPPHNHIHSWLGVPMIAQGKVIGLLAIDSTKPDNFGEREQEIALEFANQVAVILENARKLQETQTQAITDALTGIYNRRGLFQLGESEFQRARRINRPFSAMMFDIDHFKQINDRYGHAVGDQILHQLAQRCLKNSRTTDLVGRYGGEEFIILLTETNLEAARLIAERLRMGIMKTPFHTDSGEIAITSSIGVSEAKHSDTLKVLIERADAALYRAKNSGRNRVVVSE